MSRAADGESPRSFRRLLPGVPAVGLVGTLILVPLAVLLAYSFWPTSASGEIEHAWSFDNYRALFTSDTYAQALVRTIVFVSLASGLTVVVAFPMAYCIATKVAPRRRLVLLLLAVVPFVTSYLIRVFAWMNIFGESGFLNSMLQRTGVVDAPLSALGFGMPAIVTTLVYLQFPLTFLTTYLALERTDPALRESAADLGMSEARTLVRVTLPLCRTGLLAGFALAFMAMVGDYVTPRLIGGTEGTFYANLIVNQFGASQQWGFGASLTFLMLATLFTLLVAVRRALGGVAAAGEDTRRYEPRRAPWLRLYSAAMLVILYLPIALVFVLALNSSESVGLPIRGITLAWFAEALRDQQILTALSVSLRIATISVLLGVVTGALAAVPIARERGRLRDAGAAILSLPLFFPPVVLGVGLIIALNALGVERGTWLIVLGHTLLIVPVVTFMAVARLEGLPANQEAAATDLGAPPWRAFILVTVPQLAPAIAAAAIVGFALSMDEFILTFLVTGSTTTLPLYIYGSLRFGIGPELVALAAMMLAFSLGLLALAAALMSGLRGWRRRSRRLGAASAVGGPLR